MALSNTAIDISQCLLCQKQGCEQPIIRVTATEASGIWHLHYLCAAGHRSRGELHLTKLSLAGQDSGQTVRTKAVGVSFCNSDGTSRQAILKCVQPGDMLRVERGTSPSGGAMYMLKHSLGYIGSIKLGVLLKVKEQYGTDWFAVRVTQITGGTENKETLGCNIELYVPADGGQSLAALLSGVPGQGDMPAPDPLVYLDPAKGIYHSDERCSGMKNAERRTLSYAVQRMHARPCKKCETQNRKEGMK